MVPFQSIIPLEAMIKKKPRALFLFSVASSLKNETEVLSIVLFLCQARLKNETITSLKSSFHPPFSFFSSTREIGDDLRGGE
jgi:hypothetical protein